MSTRTNSVYMQHNAIPILRTIDPHQRYAFVGLPCQIAASLRYSLGIRISLICHHAPSPEFTDVLLQRLQVKRDEVRQIEYRGHGWRGGCTVHLKDGTTRFTPRYWGKNHIPLACAVCKEIGAGADVVVGDPWHLGLEKTEHVGLSLVIARTVEAATLIKQASGYACAREISYNDLERSQGKHFREKLARRAKI